MVEELEAISDILSIKLLKSSIEIDDFRTENFILHKKSSSFLWWFLNQIKSIFIINQIYNNLNHYVLFFGATFCNHQSDGDQGPIADSFRKYTLFAHILNWVPRLELTL